MKKKLLTLATAILAIGIQTLQAQAPIIFQPTGGLNDGSDQGGINSGKDAWVYEGDPTTNYGTSPVVYALPISNCNATHVVGFIQFDLSSLPLNVDSVKFCGTHIPHTNYCLSNCNADFYFAPVSQAWDEMTINYQNKPTWDAAFYGPINIAFPNDFGAREYDITNMYQLWKNGTVPNYGMVVYSTTVGCNNAAVFFETYGSDDTGSVTRPFLKIYETSNGTQDALSGKIDFSLFPNPALENATVQFFLGENDKAVFRLTDVTGRLVTEEKIIEGKGQHQFPLDMSSLSKGLYFYTLETAGGTISGKVMH